MTDSEPDPSCFWTPDVLSRLRFDNNRVLLEHLRIEALKCGFDIASRQALVIPYGHFHCTKGGRVRSKNTSKCSCPFSFRTSLDDHGKIRIRIDQSLCLQHADHPLVPQLYSHKLHPPETTRCRICGFRHETTACVKYADCIAAQNRFRNYEGPHRRCGVCSEPGHNSIRCPIKRAAVEYYEIIDEQSQIP